MQETQANIIAKYKRRENLEQGFMNSSDDNESLLCVYGVQSSLQRSNIVEAVSTLYFTVTRVAKEKEYRYMTPRKETVRMMIYVRERKEKRH
jgi:hypothetical protein